VHVIGHNYFAFFSKTHHEGTIRCNGKEEEHFTAKYVTTKHVDPGCTAETDTHVATAKLQVEGETQTHAISWPRDVQDLIGEMDAAEFETARLEEENIEEVPTDTKKAAKWLAARNKWQMRHLKEWSGFGALGAVFIVVVVLGICYVVYRSRAKVARAAARALLPSNTRKALQMDDVEHGQGRQGRLVYNII
jgi:hypothetical protein